ncbi:SPOR domain-containing protein [Paracoccus sp. NGMCC 1.201697]|uniref:SPOR domain-containing protein n=1 Tax=Paracoccus broussonetiae subsp. drimophilus TaxID=3373869 RepID=A0ABW7LQF6_9RHOB
MGRRLLSVLIWTVLSWPASAVDLRPAEEPPADFAGRQYVDSRGCVFLQDQGGRWQARLARDGSAVCGFTPTSSIRGTNGQARLRALDPDAGKSRAQLIEQAITDAVIPNLRPGELASDPRPPEELPDMGPEPMASAALDTLRASVRAAPALREAMGRDLQPNRRLCRLLGYDGQPSAAGGGADPTSGYCGAAPASTLSRLAFVRPVAVASAPTAPEIKVATPAKAVARKVALPARGAQMPRAARIGLIPASARYVRLGSFAAGAEAQQVARRVSDLGYSVQRVKSDPAGQAVLLAGPFDTREAIVRALDRLRRNGFGQAVPR